MIRTNGTTHPSPTNKPALYQIGLRDVLMTMCNNFIELVKMPLLQIPLYNLVAFAAICRETRMLIQIVIYLMYFIKCAWRSRFCCLWFQWSIFFLCYLTICPDVVNWGAAGQHTHTRWCINVLCHGIKGSTFVLAFATNFSTLIVQSWGDC